MKLVPTGVWRFKLRHSGATGRAHATKMNCLLPLQFCAHLEVGEVDGLPETSLGCKEMFFCCFGLGSATGVSGSTSQTWLDHHHLVGVLAASISATFFLLHALFGSGPSRIGSIAADQIKTRTACSVMMQVLEAVLNQAIYQGSPEASNFADTPTLSRLMPLSTNLVPIASTALHQWLEQLDECGVDPLNLPAAIQAMGGSVPLCIPPSESAANRQGQKGRQTKGKQRCPEAGLGTGKGRDW